MIFLQIEVFYLAPIPLCSIVGESVLDFLLCCHVVCLVCRDMAEWVGFLGYRGMNFKESFLEWFSFSKQAKLRKDKEGVLSLVTC